MQGLVGPRIEKIEDLVSQIRQEFDNDADFETLTDLIDDLSAESDKLAEKMSKVSSLFSDGDDDDEEETEPEAEKDTSDVEEEEEAPRSSRGKNKK